MVYNPLRRFSLRALLVVVTLAAMLLAGWSTLIEPYRRQATGLSRFNDLLSSPRNMGATTAAPNLNAEFEPMEDSLHRTLVEWVVGREASLKVRSLHFPSGTREEDLRFTIPRMKYLTLVEVSETNVSEDIARVLAKLPELNTLLAVRANIDDDAVAALSRSKTIESMMLTANPFGDQSVAALARMKQLDEIFLRWSKLTESGADMLREELPDCSIWFQGRAVDAGATEIH